MIRQRKTRKQQQRRRAIVPRGMSVTFPRNTSIIPLTTYYSFNLTTDFNASFSFDTKQAYIETSPIAVSGLSELNATWELMRVAKVEVTILPAANALLYSDQTVTSGQTNIPYVHTAIDYVDPVNGKSPTQIVQNPTLQIDTFNHTIRRTFVPRLSGNNGVLDAGANYRNLFMQAGLENSQVWTGFVIWIDMASQVWTYGIGRIYFKIYYECAMSR